MISLQSLIMTPLFAEQVEGLIAALFCGADLAAAQG